MSKRLLASTINFSLAKTKARTRICPRNASTRHTNGTLSVRFIHRHGAANVKAGDILDEDLARPIHSHSHEAAEIGSRARSAEELEQDLPRQTTILSSATPSSEIQDFIIKRLRSMFCMSRAAYQFHGAKARQGLAILATPKYARWLEDNADFIPRVLTAITRSWKQRLIHEDTVIEIDVMSACIDGLSPSVEFMPNLSKPLKGLSFLHGVAKKTLPDLFAEGKPAGGGPEALSSLTFSGEGSFDADITFPLANTLFVNGKMSFLRASRWRRTGDGSFVKVKAMDKHHQVVNAFTGMANEMLSYIPATPLTPARPITSGLGNIVRSIEFDDGPGPASRELEEYVDRYRENLMRIKDSSETSSETTTSFSVWALVFPEVAIDRNRKLGWPHHLQTQGGQVHVATRDKAHDYIGHWIKQGASFCRVLSGGGGWGAKQGLLSLDPQTTYQEVEQSQLDFAHGSIEEQQSSALGNIAKPGDFIQFYVANLGKANSTPDKRFSDYDPKRRTVTIGTTPSTIDNMPAKEDEASTLDVRVRNGHFGGVSQSGIYLSKKVPGDSTESSSFATKLDLPHSYVFGWTDSAVLVEEFEEPDR